jgi:glycosyltransferase involved in cell wall biosynthesis
MFRQPMVTIVVPTYNHVNYLKKALESIQAQTYHNYEIVVVDNHSTDGTEDYIKTLQIQNLKYLKIENNGIIARSRNHGVANSTGEYLAFLDSDDFWEPTKLMECIDYMVTREIKALCHGEQWYYETTGKTRNIRYGRTKIQTMKQLFMHGNCISTSAVIMQKDVFSLAGGFDENPDLVTVEDYDLWLKLAKCQIYFSFIDQILGTYRIHSMNTINSVQRYATGLHLIFNTYCKDPEVNSHSIFDKIQIRRRYGFIYYDIGRMYHKSGDLGNAFTHYVKSTMIWPFNWRNIAATALLIKNVYK